MRLILLPFFWAVLSMAVILIFNPASMLAQTTAPGAATTADPAQQTSAEKFIQDLGNQAISVMADKNMPPDQRSQKYRAILQSSFDMPTVGHFVLGRAWNSASPRQQQEFMKLFEQIVLKTYGDRLNFYSGEDFQVKGERQESDKDTIVNSEVAHPNGAPPTKIDWRLRQANGKPAVIDVIIEGVSQSVTQRDEYASILQRNNGNLDALLDLMRQRVQEPQQQGATTQN